MESLPKELINKISSDPEKRLKINQLSKSLSYIDHKNIINDPDVWATIHNKCRECRKVYSTEDLSILKCVALQCTTRSRYFTYLLINNGIPELHKQFIKTLAQQLHPGQLRIDIPIINELSHLQPVASTRILSRNVRKMNVKSHDKEASLVDGHRNSILLNDTIISYTKKLIVRQNTDTLKFEVSKMPSPNKFEEFFKAQYPGIFPGTGMFHFFGSPVRIAAMNDYIVYGTGTGFICHISFSNWNKHNMTLLNNYLTKTALGQEEYLQLFTSLEICSTDPLCVLGTTADALRHYDMNPLNKGQFFSILPTHSNIPRVLDNTYPSIIRKFGSDSTILQISLVDTTKIQLSVYSVRIDDGSASKLREGYINLPDDHWSNYAYAYYCLTQSSSTIWHSNRLLLALSQSSNRSDHNNCFVSKFEIPSASSKKKIACGNRQMSLADIEAMKSLSILPTEICLSILPTEILEKIAQMVIEDGVLRIICRTIN